MFFLYNMLLDSSAINTTGNNTNIDTIQISNGIFDHLNLLNIISTQTNVFDYETPNEWTENTIMNAVFNGSIDAGSLGDFVGYVDHLEVQRQEVGSNEWITLQKIYKNYETGEIKANFVMQDTYAQNDTLYTYQIVPVDIYGNVGYALQQDILSKFNDAYIADANHIYKITNEYTIGSMQREQASAVYVPYGSKFPFVAYNAVTNYDSGSITAVLLSPTSNSETHSCIDRKAQVKLVEEFNSWLTNGRAKILKDFNGKLKLINVINPVPNSYYKELGNGLASTTFNFVEVGNMTQEYLDKLGMTNKFDLKYKD